jgi:BirA family biotin operon repressor/biotin-[acetyl-CoA-carboxylase] ligase
VLEKIAGEGFRLKWPNDIYWNTRKIGGILIENVIGARETIEGVVPVAPHMTGDLSNRSNQWKWAVTGIGINVNESGFPFGLGGAVSLFQITGQRTDPVKLAHLVCGNLANYLTNPVADLHSIIESYNQNLYCLGENVSFRRAGTRFTAIVKGVTASGELVIRHAIDESVRHGEIEWLTPAH